MTMCQTFLIRYKLHVVFWKMKKESECGFPSIMCVCLCMCVCVCVYVCVCVCACMCVCGSLSPSLIHHGYPAHLCRPTARVPLSTTSLTRAFDTRVRYVQPKCKHTHTTHTQHTHTTHTHTQHTHNPLLSTKMCNSTHTSHTHITHTHITHTSHTHITHHLYNTLGYHNYHHHTPHTGQCIHTYVSVTFNFISKYLPSVLPCGSPADGGVRGS